MNTTATPINRIPSIDALRGLLILLVVVGHVLQFSSPDYDSNLAFRLIYSFHMPLFIFISGYVSSNDSKTPWLTLKKRFLSLVIPFFAWLPLTFLWMNYSQGESTISISDFIFQVIKSPDAGGLWFLWVLFLLNFLIIICRIISQIHTLTIALAFYCLLNMIALLYPSSNVLGFKLVCWHFLFFIMGTAWRKYRASLQPSNGTMLISGLAFLMLFPIWQRVGNSSLELFFSDSPNIILLIVNRIYNYVTACAAIFALLGLFVIYFDKFKPNFLVLRFFGSITLEIYATHIYFISWGISLTSQFINYPLLRTTVIFLVALTGAVFTQAAIKRIDLISLIFFGKKPLINPGYKLQPYPQAQLQDVFNRVLLKSTKRK
ncbi:hypothetical protein MTYM_00165 [Methylococcales bacterium]|nr:hypothetical protein MTYM_00165 [Methylococcales bacterium]